MTGFDLQEFRARRLGQLDDLRDLLLPAVENALGGDVVNYDVLL